MTRVLTVSPNPVLDRTMIVPDLRLNEVLYSTATYLDPSGKGFNVSRALKGLGMESIGFGFFGGATGELIQEKLREVGVEVRPVPIQGETRTNVVIADAAGKLHIKANEAGPHVTDEEVATMLGEVEQEVQAGDLCVMTGSLPRGVASDFYARLITIVRSRGARPVLDSSGAALDAGIRTRPWLLKINGLEAGNLLGVSVESVEQAAAALPKLHAFGMDVVAISLGEEGVVGSAGGETYWAKSPPVQALNAVGAGDALMGGMIWALAQDLPFADALRWGVATATAKVLRPSITYAPREDVEVWLPGVQVHSLPTA